MKKNAKRLLSLMLCLMMVLAMLPVAALAADTLRVYCQAPASWENCNAYWWGSSVENPGWPGKAMNQDAEGIWYIDIPVDTPNIIFNNGSGSQSSDLKVPTDDKLMFVYTTKEWVSYGKQEVEEPDPVVVYLINSGKWNGAYAHAWIEGGAGTSWPGMGMTKTEDTINGFDIYKAVFDVAYENIIFNNGSGTQTGDMALNANQYYDYAAGKWYTSLDEVPALDPLATGAFLTGDFNGWNTTANEFRLDAEGASVGYVSLELDAGATFGFKVVNNGAWTSCTEAILGDVEGLIFSDSVADNASITTVAAGTYVFAWDVNTGALSVTYPENVCSHKNEVVSGYDATCTEPGLTDGSKCALCGEVFTLQEEIPALGHNFENGSCTVCGEEQPKPVYLINSGNWDGVYVHAWIEGGASTSWPGMEMTKTDDTINGFDIYKAAFDVAYENIIFNNGSGTQTGDMALNAGQYYDYAAGEWYASLDEVPALDPLATGAFLTGDFNGWNTTANEFRLDAEGASVGYVSLELDAGATFGFKVVNNGAWTSCTEAILGDVEGLIFSDSVSDNASITTVAAGTYVFAWDVNTGALSVTYPENVCVHEVATLEGYAATCTEPGLTDGSKCGLCGEVFVVQDEIPALGHDFVDGVCSVCGAKSHVTVYFQNNWGWSEVSLYFWGSALEEDPQWPGIAMEYYGYDGTYDIYTLVVPSDVDALIINGLKDDGSGERDQTPNITDAYDGVVYYMAWDNGNTVGSLDISDVELVNCKHEEETLPGYDATCTETGLTEGSKCSLCGEVFIVQEEIPALGHNFVESVCSVCGTKSHMTVYFQNNWGWSEVSLYFWGSALEEDPQWPGIAMEYYSHDGTYDIYTLVVPSDANALIINGVKDDGSGERDQTPDIIDAYDGVVYYMLWDNGNKVGSFNISDVELQCKHSWTEATCSAPKTCELCGETEGDVVDHSFENGVCIFGCGRMYDPDGLKFMGACLVLESDLSVYYKLSLDLLENSGYDNPYVVFNFNGVETKVDEYMIEGNEIIFIFENVSPDRMNDTITSTLYAFSNGNTVECETREYSVATYCYNMLAKYSGEKCDIFRTLIVDLLNYGAESQKYNQYKTDALVNAALTDEQKAWGTAENRTLVSVQDAAYITIENPTVAWTCAGLNLTNAVAMRFKVDAQDVENLCVKVEDDQGNLITWANFVQGEDGYYVYLEVLAATQMSKAICLTVYEGETAVSNTARYSIESYAFAKQDSEDVQLSALVKAMMRYGDAAKAFFD